DRGEEWHFFFQIPQTGPETYFLQAELIPFHGPSKGNDPHGDSGRADRQGLPDIIGPYMDCANDQDREQDLRYQVEHGDLRQVLHGLEKPVLRDHRAKTYDE